MELQLLESVNDEGTYCWLIDIGGLLVGVHAESGWCVRINESVLVLDAENKYVPLGPLLEVPAEKFFAFLEQAAMANPSYGQQIRGFPKETLLKHIFHTSYSSYWPERALTWLATDRALWPKFREELQLFSTNKVMPQAARQHAQKMLQALES